MNNILLNQIKDKGFSEYIPPRLNEDIPSFLSFDKNINWISFCNTSTINVNYDSSGNIYLDTSLNVFKDTGLNFKDQRIGIGRIPLYNYRFDIGIPNDALMTALHIGDGTYGLSFGNGTNSGFLPQIIGIGADENDAGLYLLAKTTHDIDSNIPLTIIDSRRNNNKPIESRPLFGITNAEYSKYKFLVYPNGNINIDGKVNAKDFIYDNSISMIDLINEINILKIKIQQLENK